MQAPAYLTYLTKATYHAGTCMTPQAARRQTLEALQILWRFDLTRARVDGRQLIPVND